MVQQITKGIKISVANRFEGKLDNNSRPSFAFSYTITIENQSKSIVQLVSRRWEIKDALNITEVVEGDGVIGVQPILQPGETHTYSSGCFLKAPVGAMQGTYKMMNFDTAEYFSVTIPTFKLNAAFAMN
jgi:ApaG protein